MEGDDRAAPSLSPGDSQLPTERLGAVAHGAQPVRSGTDAVGQPPAVVGNEEVQPAIDDREEDFHVACFGVAHGVGDRLAADAIGVRGNKGGKRRRIADDLDWGDVGPAVSRRCTGRRSAGLVLAGSFALLALVPLRSFRELAFVTSVGLLIDAFIVRTVLVPAAIALVGEPQRLAGHRLRRRRRDSPNGAPTC